MSQSDDFLTEGSAGDVTRQSTVVTVTDGEVKGLNRVSTIPRKFVHVDSFRGAIVDDAEDGSVIVDGQVDGFHRVETASKEFERVHSVRADILDDTSEEVANADDETFDEVLENGFLQKSVVGANGWKMVAIPANTVYYYNAVTGVVQWSSPLGPSISNEIPPPPPPPEVRTPSPPPPPGPPPKSLILPTPPPKTASSYKFKPTVLSPKSNHSKAIIRGRQTSATKFRSQSTCRQTNHRVENTRIYERNRVL
ncbi:hypothetical protein BDR26DRAFT_331175 [Obelidium mucronatum]|nr:hypothetical protein BDR26DRAFT_331175 [Obelidium mucronatum]